MRERSLTISAESEEKARSEAAVQLGTHPDNIRVHQSPNGEFRVELINADADLDFDISDDGMEAKISAYAPPRGNGALLTRSRIKEILTQSGLVVDPDPDGLSEVSQRLERGAGIEGIVIARGEEPRKAKNAELDPIGDLKKPVLPGDIFARKQPAKPPHKGRTVTGADVEPDGPSEARDLTIHCKPGCSLDKDGLAVQSDVYGLATIVRSDVRVDNLIEISSDNMHATATIYAETFDDTPMDIDRFKSVLETLQITAPPDEQSIETALAKARETGEPVEDVYIASGTPPQDGKDGHLDLKVEVQQEVGTEKEDGSVDFKERGTVHSVHQGAFLGKVAPPTRGVPGKDLFGTTLPARDGEPASISIGENVSVSEDKTEFVSEIDGMVLFVRDTISVTPVLQIEGDINFATGNIHTDTGSVAVKGTVQSGFQIESSANVVVEQAIENANIKAGGNVEVHRGILMDEGAAIEVKGDVYAHFAQNAHIHAGGTVEIDNDITNCEIIAGAKVIAVHGKGRIQGGTIRAVEGVEANEIGSDLNVTTTIILGEEHHEHSGVMAKMRALEETVRKIDRVFGTGDIRAILTRTPPAKRPAVAKLLKARLSAREQLTALEAKLAELEEEKKKRSKARLKVRKTIHPGTVVVISGCKMNVEHAINASQLYYDPKADAIRWGPI